MINRENVIKGLEKVWDAFNHMEHELYADYVFDALVLLKEHIKLEPEKVFHMKERSIINETHGKTGFCPRCNQVVIWEINRRYCGFCGKGLIWDGD